jgi:hypothetical protein
MIRATGAKLRMLASLSWVLSFLFSEARDVVVGDGDEEAWDMIGRVAAVARPKVKRLRSEVDNWPIVEHSRVNGRSDTSHGEPQHAPEGSLCAQIRRRERE